MYNNCNENDEQLKELKEIKGHGWNPLLENLVEKHIGAIF